MGLVWHRALQPDDVATAHQLLDQHQPFVGSDGEHRCVNALHPADRKPPLWPCTRTRWAHGVLNAEQRGEIPPTPEGSE